MIYIYSRRFGHRPSMWQTMVTHIYICYVRNRIYIYIVCSVHLLIMHTISSWLHIFLIAHNTYHQATCNYFKCNIYSYDICLLTHIWTFYDSTMWSPLLFVFVSILVLWFECRFLDSMVDGSNPDITMVCPWSRHFIALLQSIKLWN